MFATLVRKLKHNNEGLPPTLRPKNLPNFEVTKNCQAMTFLERSGLEKSAHFFGFWDRRCWAHMKLEGVVPTFFFWAFKILKPSKTKAPNSKILRWWQVAGVKSHCEPHYLQNLLQEFASSTHLPATYSMILGILSCFARKRHKKKHGLHTERKRFHEKHLVT